MIDASVPNSPEWWLMRLGTRLGDEATGLDELDHYAEGDHPLPEGHRKARDAYRRFQQMARTNFCGLISSAVGERLAIQAFTTGGTDKSLDKGAWGLWQANSLDADAGIVHRDALVMGRSYVIVGPPTADDPGVPVITPEDPRLVIHECDPIRRRTVIAALKTWHDDIGSCQRAIVYLPDGYHYFKSPQVDNGDTPVAWNGRYWDVDTDTFAGGMAPNTIGRVPVVPFVNKGGIRRLGHGEFEDVTGIQDRINVTVLDRLVIQSMQAFRQRWASGVQLYDENGNTVDDFDPGADLVWAVEDTNVKFGDFAQADIAPIMSAAQADITHMAAITRTPVSYLMSQMVNVSGDALIAAEIGLIAKVRARQLEFGESWEQVLRLADAYVAGAVQPNAEIAWVDPAQYGLTQLADAAVKYEMAGVPWRTRMEILGFSPQAIDRMDTERMQDALLAEKLAPLTATAPASVNPDVGDYAPPKPRAS